MSNTAIQPVPPQPLVVQDFSAVSYLMDTAKFEHCYRIARLMATASLIPDHLRLNMKTKEPLPIEQVEGNCFMIVNQALRWGFDPFSVAPETYVVGGKLAYQGKLVAAAVNALAGLVRDLDYSFSGKPGSDDFTITVTGQKVGEDKPRTVTVSVGQAKTDNQMWRKDPEQKLVYNGVVKWTRRHAPGVIMGILIPEDLEYEELRDVTPRPTPTVKANPFKAGAAAPSELAVLSDTAPPETATPTTPAFDRKAKLQELAQAVKTSGRKNAEALTIFLAAGLLGSDAKAISDATDEQIEGILAATHLLEKTAEEPASEPIATPTPTEQWLDRLEELGLQQEPPLKMHQIEALCRKAGVLSPTATLKGAKEERLASIHANFHAILEKAGKEEA